MRAGALAAMAITATCAGVGARAEPVRLEASGFVGVAALPADTELGNSWAAEQVPGTSALVGARLAWVAAPTLRESPRLQLVLEGELALAPAFTGAMRGTRAAYFAPVFGWRAHALLRVATPRVQPHLLAGAGGETVASSSPFMAKETDPVAYWGIGAAVPIRGRWRVRLDGRHGLMPDRGAGVTSTFELQLGIAATFGVAPPPRRDREAAPPPAFVDAPAAADRRPEPAAEVEIDADADGLAGRRDRCPDVAEDRDGTGDDDGCPDPDDDGDGLADADDRCPREGEVMNGIADADGCPDVVPETVTRALARAGTIGFARGSARLPRAAAGALAPLRAVLRAHRDLRIAIVAHPETASTADAALARRRAEAVKWHLVDAGIETARITIVGGAPGAQRIEARLDPRPGA